MTDREILGAYRLLGIEEGVFVEPARAASVAGLLKAAEQGKVDPGQKIVCTVTGNGLKDPTGRSPAHRSRSPSRWTPTPRPNGWV